MNKFIKENWFKAGILLIFTIVVLLFTCHERKRDNLIAQEKCSKAAEEFFKRQHPDGSYNSSETHNYTSHYNSRMNKCFIFVNDYSSVPTQNTGEESSTLSDVYENKMYAEYYRSWDTKGDIVNRHHIEKGGMSVGETCKADDFYKFTESYMKE